MVVSSCMSNVHIVSINNLGWPVNARNTLWIHFLFVHETIPKQTRNMLRSTCHLVKLICNRSVEYRYSDFSWIFLDSCRSRSRNKTVFVVCIWSDLEIYETLAKKKHWPIRLLWQYTPPRQKFGLNLDFSFGISVTFLFKCHSRIKNM